MKEINYFDNRFLMFVLDKMAYEYEKENKDVIRLTLGNSELPLHEDIRTAMHEALDDYKKYSLVFPSGLPELKEGLAKEYNQRYQLDINPENFIISLGTSTVFRNIFQLLLSEDDEVLLPLPYYSLYRFSTLLQNAKIRYYKIDLKTLSVDMESFKENFTDKTKIVVINNPGNPLGNIITKEELYGIDSFVNGRAVIVSDEIYSNVCFEEKATSVLELENKKSQYIVTNAFSKGYRMYSRRVGYCIVPDEMITPLAVMQHHTLLTVDPVVQFGALAALKHPEEVEILCQNYKQRAEYTMNKLGQLDVVNVIPSKGGFYITLDCEKYMKRHEMKTSLELAEAIMKKKYVATVPGEDFGLPNTLRLSFSNLRYNEGIDRIYRFFNSMEEE